MLEVIDGREVMTPVHIPRPRPVSQSGDPQRVVSEVVEDVRLRGDAALVELTKRFDGADLGAVGIRVDPDHIHAAKSLVPA